MISEIIINNFTRRVRDKDLIYVKLFVLFLSLPFICVLAGCILVLLCVILFFFFLCCIFNMCFNKGKISFFQKKVGGNGKSVDWLSLLQQAKNGQKKTFEKF